MDRVDAKYQRNAKSGIHRPVLQLLRFFAQNMQERTGKPLLNPFHCFFTVNFTIRDLHQLPYFFFKGHMGQKILCSFFGGEHGTFITLRNVAASPGIVIVIHNVSSKFVLFIKTEYPRPLALVRTLKTEPVPQVLRHKGRFSTGWVEWSLMPE